MLEPYLHLAAQLDEGSFLDHDLLHHAALLPGLDEQLLKQAASHAQKASLSRPRLGWALAKVADAAAQHTDDPFLQALAAFHLARAANEWVRPARAAEAARRGRAGFARLHAHGWAAACDWQLFALPWTRNRFEEAEATLARALEEMLAAGLDDWVPDCRLSLAYAHILLQDYPKAEAQIASAERAYLEREDALGLARCWLHRASLLRRSGGAKEAVDWLARARELLLPLNAPVEVAKVCYQMAYCRLVWQTDYQLALDNLTQAREIFAAADVPLWQALCENGLAQVHNNKGNLTAARHHLQSAQEIFARYQILGTLADSVLDTARLEMLAGNYPRAVELAQKAEALHTEIGAEWMAAVGMMFQGEAWSQMGRYQTALGHLERAYPIFQENGDRDRQALCELLLAQVWLFLRRSDLALPYLEKAREWYQASEDRFHLSQTYGYLALASYQQGQLAESIQTLQTALDMAEQAAILPQIAFNHRLLGVVFLANRAPDQALAHLQKSVEIFRQAGMYGEQALSLVKQGYCYEQLSRPEAAKATWEAVLQISQGAAPQADWQAYAGLARLAESAGNQESALSWYEQMRQTLRLLRLGFWQPSLLEAYSARQTEMLYRAVTLVAASGQPERTLAFIEESKAQLVVRQIDASTGPGQITVSELDPLREEIFWLKNRLNQLHASENPSLLESGNVRQQLKQKIRQYDYQLAWLERRQTDQLRLPSTSDFSISDFRQAANVAYGAKWLALDYYLADSTLNCITLTPQGCTLSSHQINPYFKLLLRLCAKADQFGYTLNDHDLTTLGRVILPPDLSEKLSPDTHLILCPHGGLHAVPWPALPLPLPASNRPVPLAANCIPVLTPSLHSLSALHRRTSPDRAPSALGLVLAIADFSGRHPALPQVHAEAQFLRTTFGERVRILIDQEAVWEQLLALRGEDGLRRFAFLHLATHAFHDPVTARLSGFALYERDVWLEHVWELAPLPALVVLSACSGVRSQVYAGDEQVGLALTCLVAGAQTVIGSLWPVLDEDAARLMADFYRSVLSRTSPAQSLAEAQRAAIRRGQAPERWSGFVCMGTGL